MNKLIKLFNQNTKAFVIGILLFIAFIVRITTVKLFF
jgi:hypothetical protein